LSRQKDGGFLVALSQAVPSPPPAEFQFWAGNILDDFCEVDSSINVLDVVRVRNKALGRPPLCPCSGPVPDTSASVWAPASAMSISMVKEGLRSYLIMVQGAQDLSGLQLEFRGVAPKARVELIGLTAGQSWQAATEHADGHGLRAVAFSNTAAGISGDGAVLRLSGTGKPKLVNVIASDSQGREIPLP